MRKGKQSKSQSRAGRTRPVAFPGSKYMVLKFVILPLTHGRIASVKDYWLCILTVGWLAVTGWQMTSAAEMPGSRILLPSSAATIINPASDRAHQPARGARTPFRCYGDGGVTQTIVVLLTIFSCCFVSYSYSHVPRFCHWLVSRICLPGLC